MYIQSMALCCTKDSVVWNMKADGRDAIKSHGVKVLDSVFDRGKENRKKRPKRIG